MSGSVSSLFRTQERFSLFMKERFALFKSGLCSFMKRNLETGQIYFTHFGRVRNSLFRSTLFRSSLFRSSLFCSFAFVALLKRATRAICTFKKIKRAIRSKKPKSEFPTQKICACRLYYMYNTVSPSYCVWFIYGIR